MVEALKMRWIEAIREFFDRAGQPVSLAELRKLSKEERLALARDCAKEMDVELEEP